MALMPALVGAETQDASTLKGTWVSKSWGVMTGPDSFIEPKVTGSSFAFDGDGHFERAEYLTTANPEKPSCPKASLIFQHGNYTLENNGSLVLTPIVGDGRMLISDACVGEKAAIMRFDDGMIVKRWEVVEDQYRKTINGKTQMRLNMWGFDGAPINPLYLASKDPVMNPTGRLDAFKKPDEKDKKKDSDTNKKLRKRTFQINLAYFKDASHNEAPGSGEEDTPTNSQVESDIKNTLTVDDHEAKAGDHTSRHPGQQRLSYIQESFWVFLAVVFAFAMTTLIVGSVYIIVDGIRT
ncbi:chaperone for protein-folding within the ER, fungal-domain-containing protein [Peziza echinospora]|nr:chaperone for protein-folding within the ER, fungal-domain-containing protein [Peziza echinospora]